MMNGSHMIDNWMMGIGPLMMLVILALLTFAIAFIIRRKFVGNPYSGYISPIDILQERLARGDIEKDEYLNLKQQLEK